MRRSGTAALFPLGLDRQSRKSLHRQLHEQIRDAILTGRLSADDKLPSSRALADEMGIARNTVLLAYDALWSEGLVTGGRGAGTRVTATAAARRRPTRTPPRASSPGPRLRGSALAPVRKRLGGLSRSGGGSAIFSVGVPSLEPRPRRLWLRATQRYARRLGSAPLEYDGPLGHPDLRAAIAAHLNASRNMSCEAANIVITPGSQAALDLAARLLLQPGDRAWVENPGYSWAVATLTAAGAVPVPVPVDAEGLVVEEGRRRASGARLAYVIPSHQFPTGVAMSLRRRMELLEWAAGRDAWVVEDDYDSEFQYGGSHVTSLHGLDTSARVLYIGTFTKTLFPGIRLGYLVVPPDLAADAALLQEVTGHVPPILDQCGVAELLTSGDFARYVRRCRRLYRYRQERIVQLLGELPDGCDVSPARAGLHMVIWLPSGVRDTACVSAVLKEGVHLLPLSAFALEPLPREGLLLGFGDAAGDGLPAAVRAVVRGVKRAVLDARLPGARGRRARQPDGAT